MFSGACPTYPLRLVNYRKRTKAGGLQKQGCHPMQPSKAVLDEEDRAVTHFWLTHSASSSPWERMRARIASPVADLISASDPALPLTEMLQRIARSARVHNLKWDRFNQSPFGFAAGLASCCFYIFVILPLLLCLCHVRRLHASWPYFICSFFVCTVSCVMWFYSGEVWYYTRDIVSTVPQVWLFHLCIKGL